jgi:hypothetical protein
VIREASTKYKRSNLGFNQLCVMHCKSKTTSSSI